MAPGTIAVDVRHKSDLMRSDWFGTAMSNPGFMHSLLCTAALHLYIVGRGSIDTIFYHKARAIAAINSAISNPDTNSGISDANIGAVFNLLCVEESLLLPFFQQEVAEENQPNQREIHLNGLRRMVQLRGGLKAIDSNRILQAFILWCVAALYTGPPKPVWHPLTEHQAFNGARHSFIRSSIPIHYRLHQHIILSASSSWVSAEHFKPSSRLLPCCTNQGISDCTGRVRVDLDR